MERNTIEKIFNFLKEKEDKQLPKKWVKLIEKLKLIKELENHPDGIQYKHNGDLLLVNTNITKLPNDLHVTGNFGLENCKQLKVLPSKLYVGGNLLIAETNIAKLSNNLYVGGNLQLAKLGITKLPNDLHVRGSFKLYGCEELTELPDNLYVKDFFVLAGCNQIIELPNNLYVGGALHMTNTPLAKKYTNEEIYEIVASTGGQIIGQIYKYK